MSDTRRKGARVRRRSSRPSPILLAAGLVVCTGVLSAPALSRASVPEETAMAIPAVTPVEPSIAALPAVLPTAAPTPVPTAIPTPTPTPAPPAFDFSQPVPEGERVSMDYFSDALFIGDSRTDGLQLYSGIKGSTFYCYKGITVFDVMEEHPKQVLNLDGKKCSIQEALKNHRGEFQKVYLSLGVNELGYNDDESFYQKFCALIDLIRATQPEAVIYLQNLVPVNPELCAKYWGSYVNNEKIAVYNGIFERLAADKQVYLVDVAGALSNEAGILNRENTVDGVHFTKDWYQTWLAYLMNHTVVGAE